MGNMKSPTETVETVIAVGLNKSRQKFGSHVILGLLAGVYIGFGAVLSIKVTGNLDPSWGNFAKLLFGLTFPAGLLMVVVAGASLFTGDVMYMTGSKAAGDINWGTWARYLFLSYVLNFLGSALFAQLIFQSGVLSDPGPGGTLPLVETAVKLANSKTGLSFLPAFLRGVFCNWLVCLAIYMSLSATDGVSKAVVLWPPITAFVALGMEHSVANMCFIPLGIFLGNSAEAVSAGIVLTATWKTFLVDNLIPVTLGNIVGGALFVALPYALVNRPGKN
ncbi:MAG: formate/nitrite transporter family protein [Deltaproteobacteria bacterium]|jgi:formate/nitrite transporter|nr:formate/nitrite transporter family protein [Deltaproteobacteria bacterium]